MPRQHHAARRAALAAELLEDRVNPVSFEYGDSGWTGSNAMSIAFGEVNCDGKIDMAVGTASGIEVYSNDGAGDFTQIANITGTGFPEQMELADMTGDGIADIVSGLSFAHYVAVVPSNGDGTFGAPVVKQLSYSVQDVFPADFNGDGKLDVVAAIPGGAAVLFNTGTAAILGEPTYYNYSSSGGGAWVAVGDFNGDGKPEFAVSVHQLKRVDVYLNDGTGNFTRTEYPNPVIDDTGDILTGDFTDDGHLDLAVSYAYTGMIGIMRGNGDGTFQTATITHSGNPSSGPLAAADFDVDGKLDLVTMSHYGNVLVLPGNGNGTFAPSVPLGASSPGDVAAADVNGDGKPDLGVSSSSSAGTFNILVNTTEVVVLDFDLSAPATTIAGEELLVTVTARDGNGEIMTEYGGTVHFTSTDGEAFLPADYQFTNVDGGVHTFAVTLFTAGNQTITVQDTANADADGSDVVAVSAAGLSALEMEAPDEATVGVPFSVTITARDEFGNLVRDYDGTLHFSSTDPAAVLPGDATLTDGVGTFSVTLMTPGTWTVTATDLAANIFAESGPIEVSEPLGQSPIVADFGNRGLQRWTEGDGWIILSSLNAERAVLSADGSTVVADFGSRGLQLWTEADGWTTLSSANVEKAVVSADGTAVIADFGGAGLRRWTDTDGWERISPANVQNVYMSRDGQSAVADLGSRGLRRWTGAGGWSLITALNPKHVAVDADCTSLAADFALIGLWRWTAANDEWVRLSAAGVEQILVSDDGASVVADFGPAGLRRWTESGGWLRLSPLNAERVSISPDGSTVVADFGSRGLRRWLDGAGWETLSTANVQDVLLSSTGAVVADFGVDGLQVYDTGWTTLIGLDPEQILTE